MWDEGDERWIDLTPAVRRPALWILKITLGIAVGFAAISAAVGLTGGSGTGGEDRVGSGTGPLDSATLTRGHAPPTTLAAPSAHWPSIAPAEATSTRRPHPTQPPSFAAVVTEIVDGDTLHARLHDGGQETVRIIGIDTPETRMPGTPVECFGIEATDAARHMLPEGSTIILEADPTQDSRDRYDRLLAHVFMADGRLFAAEMIKGGFGTHYVYGGVPSIHATQLAAAEAYAKDHHLGIWLPNVCQASPSLP
jgi:micrococcal nuclease